MSNKPITAELVKQLRRITEEQWVNSDAEWINKAADRLEAVKQIIEAIANRLEDEDPSLLALDIKYLINKG